MKNTIQIVYGKKRKDLLIKSKKFIILIKYDEKSNLYVRK